MSAVRLNGFGLSCSVRFNGRDGRVFVMYTLQMLRFIRAVLQLYNSVSRFSMLLFSHIGCKVWSSGAKFGAWDWLTRHTKWFIIYKRRRLSVG